jgi:hypothetical protein
MIASPSVNEMADRIACTIGKEFSTNALFRERGVCLRMTHGK